MAVTQTVEIPSGYRVTIDIPREPSSGQVILSFTPTHAVTPKKIPISQFFNILSPSTYGDGVSYQRELRDEWDD
ncbi:MAG: hypothetical protein FWC97_09370 [Treponema sp.]|nr:hypothetical protein [Treponema sp.]